jgi:hypothetical protein
MALDIASLSKKKVLTGISGGESVLTALKKALEAHSSSEPLVLDFHGIEILGASALRHVLQGISKPQTTIVLANLSEAHREEADLVAEATRLPYIGATYRDRQIINPVLRGPLDAKLKQTLQIVIQAGEADAQKVSESSGESSVVTVWNNRLAALLSMGLLRERKVGKRKFFSLAIEGLTYGT